MGSFQYRKLDKKLINWNVKTDLEGDFVKKVKGYRPDIIIMSVVEDTFKQGIELLDVIQDLKIPNMIGGIFPTVSPEEAIKQQLAGSKWYKKGMAKRIDRLKNIAELEQAYNEVNDGYLKKHYPSIYRQLDASKIGEVSLAKGPVDIYGIINKQFDQALKLRGEASQIPINQKVRMMLDKADPGGKISNNYKNVLSDMYGQKILEAHTRFSHPAEAPVPSKKQSSLMDLVALEYCH